jgi:hypothetical protein
MKEFTPSPPSTKKNTHRVEQEFYQTFRNQIVINYLKTCKMKEKKHFFMNQI